MAAATNEKYLLAASLAALLGLVAVLGAGAEEEARTPADAARIEKLVQDLGADEFPTRERASRELIQIGEPARAALERAMNESDNLEARWRAEQILRRLDSQGERPLAPAPAPRGPTGPGEAPGGLPGGAGPNLEELERRIEEFRRRLGLDADDPMGGMMGSGLRRETLDAPGLALEIDAFGVWPNLTLRVEQEGQPVRTYRGRSLEDILTRHPELEEHPGMAALKERWLPFRRSHPELFAFDDMLRGGLGSGLQMRFSGQGQGISIQQDGEGVTVVVTETDEDGKQVVKTFKGRTLDEIREKHPELKEKLDGFSFQFGPAQVFGQRPVPPARPRPPLTGPRPAGPSFGVVVRPPDPVLASQLKLDEEAALLVVQVAPGSPAEEIGLQLYDIIVGIDDVAVTSRAEAVEALRLAAQTPGPLTLDVIRHGERMRLTR